MLSGIVDCCPEFSGRTSSEIWRITAPCLRCCTWLVSAIRSRPVPMSAKYPRLPSSLVEQPWIPHALGSASCLGWAGSDRSIGVIVSVLPM